MADNTCLLATTHFATGIGKDIIVGVAAILTACVAIRGLNTWRRQLIGSSKFDTAKKLKKSIYKVQHSIDALRSRGFRSSENLDSEKIPGGDTRAKIERLVEEAYNKRWALVNNSMVEFEDNQLDAEVIIGDEVIDIGNKFRSLVRQLEIDLGLYLEMKSWVGFDPNHETYKSIRSTVVENVDKNSDIFLANVKAIVAEYKTMLDKYIHVTK